MIKLISRSEKKKSQSSIFDRDPLAISVQFSRENVPSHCVYFIIEYFFPLLDSSHSFSNIINVGASPIDTSTSKSNGFVIFCFIVLWHSFFFSLQVCLFHFIFLMKIKWYFCKKKKKNIVHKNIAPGKDCRIFIAPVFGSFLTLWMIHWFVSSLSLSLSNSLTQFQRLWSILDWNRWWWKNRLISFSRVSSISSTPSAILVIINIRHQRKS